MGIGIGTGLGVRGIAWAGFSDTPPLKLSSSHLQPPALGTRPADSNKQNRVRSQHYTDYLLQGRRKKDPLHPTAPCQVVDGDDEDEEKAEDEEGEEEEEDQEGKEEETGSL